jgi:hypothetical protein
VSAKIIDRLEESKKLNLPWIMGARPPVVMLTPLESALDSCKFRPTKRYIKATAGDKLYETDTPDDSDSWTEVLSCE